MTRLLSKFLLLLTLLSPFTASANLNTNNIGYWKLDESSGNPADATGNGNTLTNTNTVSFGTGLINNAADYGAANTNKDFVATNSMSYSGGAYSMNTWINVNAAPALNAAYTVVGVADNTTSKTFMDLSYLDSGGTKEVFVERNKPGVANQSVADVITFTNGTWHMLTLTYDGATLSVYVDGVFGNSVAASGNGSSATVNQFALGSNAQATANYASVKQDETGVWTRALSSAEITTLYNSGAGCAYQSASWTTCTSATATATSIIGIVRALWLW